MVASKAVLIRFSTVFFRIGRELLGNTVGDDGVERKAVVAEYPAESVDSGCFHFKIADAVVAETEIAEFA